MVINTFVKTVDNFGNENVKESNCVVCSHCGKEVTDDSGYYAGEFHHPFDPKIRNLIVCENCMKALFKY